MKESINQNQGMESQKTVECSKCHKQVLSTDGEQNVKGFVCNECCKKAKKRKISGVVGVIVIIAILVVWALMGNKQRTGEGFDGIGMIKDSISIIVDSADVRFELATTTAVSSSVVTQNPVTNLANFRRTFSENVSNAEKEKSSDLVIPSISLLFDINTNHLKNDGEALIKEFASAYNKTNKKAFILVEGFTCDLGGTNLNDKLSKLRAEKVKQILIEVGIPENMIEAKWYGKSRFNEFSYQDKGDYRRVNLSIR